MVTIHKVTKSEQWFYIPSERTPTRPIHASELQHSKWLEGPEQSELYPSSQEKILYELIDPESDKEIKQEVRCLKTNTSDFVIGDSLARISEWPKVVKCVARLRHLAIHSNMTNKIVTLNVLDGMIVEFGRTSRHLKNLRNLL